MMWLLASLIGLIVLVAVLAPFFVVGFLPHPTYFGKAIQQFFICRQARVAGGQHAGVLCNVRVAEQQWVVARRPHFAGEVGGVVS